MSECTDVDHMHDPGDWRVLGIGSDMGLSDHPDQDVQPRQSHRLVERVGKLGDMLMDILVLFLRQAESEQG